MIIAKLGFATAGDVWRLTHGMFKSQLKPENLIVIDTNKYAAGFKIVSMDSRSLFETDKNM